MIKFRDQHIYFFISSLFVVAVLFSGCVDKTEESAKNVREANRLLYGSRITEAREAFLKASDLNPENEEAWYGLGMTWMNEKKYQKAIGYFDQAIELKSNYTDAYYNRGQSWFYMGELRKACKDWQVAYDLGKPNMADKLKKCD